MAVEKTGSCVILNVTMDFLVAAWGKSVVNLFNQNKSKSKAMNVFNLVPRHPDKGVEIQFQVFLLDSR